MSTTTTELAKRQEPTLIQLIDSPKAKQQFAKALPKHMTPDRFARIAITAMRKVPKLQQCTQASVMGCLLQLSQYGLEPDGRRAHLIPYGNECTLILDYKGIAELALRSGLVSTLHADVVHRGDIFEYSMGKVYKHTPWFLRSDREKPEEEGRVFAVYAFCENKDGTQSCSVLSYEEVEAVRKRSKAANNGPWKTDWNEMAKKTAFRRLSKWLVLSPEFREAVSHDEDAEIIETTATPIKMSDLLRDETDRDEELDEPVIDRTPPASQLDDCVGYLESCCMECIDATPEQDQFTYLLANKETIKIGDGVENGGTHVVDTLDPGALSQVQNIVERVNKKR